MERLNTALTKRLREGNQSKFCKKDQKDMSDSDKERVMSTKRSYGPGEDIFGKYYPDELVEYGTTDNSTDEDEGDETEEDDEEDEYEENEEEEDVSKKTKNHKIRPWNVLVNIAIDNLQGTFNETVERKLYI